MEHNRAHVPGQLNALTPGHPHHSLLMREGSIVNSRRLTKDHSYLQRLKLSRALTEDRPTQLVAPMQERLQVEGRKVAPPKHKPTPLEIAYRAQPSRIFRAPAYERDTWGLTPIERMLPHKKMQLETQFKTSDFQPIQEQRPESMFGVQRVRDAHQAAARNAGQMGFGVTQGTFPLDTSFQNVNQVDGQSPNPEMQPIYDRIKAQTVRRGARKRGFFDDSNYFDQPARSRAQPVPQRQ